MTVVADSMTARDPESGALVTVVQRGTGEVAHIIWCEGEWNLPKHPTSECHRLHNLNPDQREQAYRLAVRADLLKLDDEALSLEQVWTNARRAYVMADRDGYGRYRDGEWAKWHLGIVADEADKEIRWRRIAERIGGPAFEPGRPSERLARIKSRLRIEDVAPPSDRARGSSRYKILCPWHGERTPSMAIYTEEQRFHCYGCGFHGDVLDWLCRQKGLTLSQLLDELEGKRARPVPTKGGLCPSCTAPLDVVKPSGATCSAGCRFLRDETGNLVEIEGDSSC